MVMWLMEHFRGETVWGTVVTKAAEVGALDILQYLKENDEGGELDDEEMDSDEEMGDEEVPLTPKQAIGWGECDAAKAAAASHTDVVKWLYEHAESDERDDDETFKAVVGSGDVELAKWLMAKVNDIPEKGAQDAAANGHLEMVQWVDEECFGSNCDTGILIRAAEKGHLNVVRWLVEREFDSDDDEDDDEDEDEGMKSASESDDEEEEAEEEDYSGMTHVDLLASVGPTRLTSVGGEATLALRAALFNGHLDIAQYLYSRAEKPRKNPFNVKESVRRLKLMQWLNRDIGVNNIGDKLPSEIMLELVVNGRLDAVKWFYTEYSKYVAIDLFWNYDEVKDTHFSVLDAATEHGHLEIVKYLDKVTKLVSPEEKAKREELSCSDYSEEYAPSSDWDDEHSSVPGCKTAAMDKAAGNGHLDIVCYLHNNRTEGFTTEAMDAAAIHGHLDVVCWLHNHRTEGCTEDAMDEAALGGHLSVVQWLHRNRKEGCSSVAMDFAAMRGHLDVVQWLHDNRSEGCTTHAIIHAASQGHLHVVEWLHENRDEGCTTEAMDLAAQEGHLRVVKWLHENRGEGCTTDAMDGAAASGHLEVVKWLHRYRSEGCTTRAMDDAAKNGHLSVVRWLHENRSEGCTALAIGNAALGRHIEVMLLLHRMRDEGCKVVMTKVNQLMSEIFQWLMEHYRDAMLAALQAA